MNVYYRFIFVADAQWQASESMRINEYASKNLHFFNDVQ